MLAQTYLGIRMGAQLTRSTSDVDHYKSSYQFGLTLEVPLGKYLQGQTELLIGQRQLQLQGFDVDATPTTFTTANIDITYLEWPLLLRLNINLPGSPLELHTLLGPQLAWALNGNSREEIYFFDVLNNTFNTEYRKIRADFNKELHRFDFGLALGIGLSYRSAVGKLFTTYRFVTGYSEINRRNRFQGSASIVSII